MSDTYCGWRLPRLQEYSHSLSSLSPSTCDSLDLLSYSISAHLRIAFSNSNRSNNTAATAVWHPWTVFVTIRALSVFFLPTLTAADCCLTRAQVTQAKRGEAYRQVVVCIVPYILLRHGLWSEIPLACWWYPFQCRLRPVCAFRVSLRVPRRRRDFPPRTTLDAHSGLRGYLHIRGRTVRPSPPSHLFQSLDVFVVSPRSLFALNTRGYHQMLSAAVY